MTISMDKKYTTRDGRPVRILCVDRDNKTYPVCGLVSNQEFTSWTREGVHDVARCHSPLDLIPAPEEVTEFVNVYRNEAGCFWYAQIGFSTESEAVSRARGHSEYLATVPITFKVPG